MPALQSSALGSGPAPTGKTQHRTLTPPNAASGRQPPLTRGRRPLAAKGSSERAESRCVCAPACRWAAHATERGPVTPPVAFRTRPHATNCRLRAPATSCTRPAPSRGKRVERAGRVAMSLRTRVFAAYMLYPVPRRTHFDNQNLPQNLRPPLEFADPQNLRWPGSKPVYFKTYFGQSLELSVFLLPLFIKMKSKSLLSGSKGSRSEPSRPRARAHQRRQSPDLLTTPTPRPSWAAAGSTSPPCGQGSRTRPRPRQRQHHRR